MPVLIILAKIGIVVVYVSILGMMFQFKKVDQHVNFEFDLLSSIEISAGIGIGLVGLFSVIDPLTYTFTFTLCLISIGIALLHRYRMILVGDHKILFAGKVHEKKEIQKLGSGLFTLRIYTKAKPKSYKIYVPLTSNHVLKDRVQDKIKQK